MSAAVAIQQFADFVAANKDWDDDPAIEHMIASGIAKTMAEETVRFVPIAFARLFLRELDVELANDYIYFRADGSVAETGALDQKEVFRAASERAPDFTQHAAFNEIAHSSSEFDGVNQALHAGSDPKDLVLGPVAIFLERPTKAGFEKAQERIIQAAREAAAFGAGPQGSASGKAVVENLVVGRLKVLSERVGSSTGLQDDKSKYSRPW